VIQAAEKKGTEATAPRIGLVREIADQEPLEESLHEILCIVARMPASADKCV
jgi:hypothetical protein